MSEELEMRRAEVECLRKELRKSIKQNELLIEKIKELEVIITTLLEKKHA